ncbi:MAG: hypothetical protein SFU99_02060 [Saprospiraceae bacterium]|nr:hypothetical protein [Saprospiraceae bacterium]
MERWNALVVQIVVFLKKLKNMIRTILTVENNVIQVPVPEEYIGRQVEIILFSLDEATTTPAAPGNRTFTTIKVNAHDFKFNRDELNER